MNEKVSKKIGEAYAFSVVLKAIQQKTPTVVESLFGELAKHIDETTSLQTSSLDELIKQSGTTDIVNTKAEKTVQKITEMGDFYVGDDWEDEAEVLEWLSFFLGAAIIHWQLILGAGKALEDKNLVAVSQSGLDYFERLMSVAKDTAERIGTDRVSSE